MGIAQIAIWPPLLRKSGHFVAQIFRQKWEHSLNSNFDFVNEYFDSDYYGPLCIDPIIYNWFGNFTGINAPIARVNLRKTQE